MKHTYEYMVVGMKDNTGADIVIRCSTLAEARARVAAYALLNNGVECTIYSRRTLDGETRLLRNRRRTKAGVMIRYYAYGNCNTIYIRALTTADAVRAFEAIVPDWSIYDAGLISEKLASMDATTVYNAEDYV